MHLVTERIACTENSELTYTTTLKLLGNFPDLKGLAIIGSLGPTGAAQALKERHLKGQVIIVGTIFPSQAPEYVKEGYIHVGFAWDPSGFRVCVGGRSRNCCWTAKKSERPWRFQDWEWQTLIQIDGSSNLIRCSISVRRKRSKPGFNIWVAPFPRNCMDHTGMQISIRTKLIMMNILLVLLTAGSISLIYYVLMTRNMQRESRQRIQIAFDFTLNALFAQREAYEEQVKKTLDQDTAFRGALYLQMQRAGQDSPVGLAAFLKKLADTLQNFGQAVAAERVFLYGQDRQLLAVYQRQAQQETVGVIQVERQSGKLVYLPFPEYIATLTAILAGEQPLPDTRVPEGIALSYTNDLPNAPVATFFGNATFGIRGECACSVYECNYWRDYCGNPVSAANGRTACRPQSNGGKSLCRNLA